MILKCVLCVSDILPTYIPFYVCDYIIVALQLSTFFYHCLLSYPFAKYMVNLYVWLMVTFYLFDYVIAQLNLDFFTNISQ
jgi:hypothetical protein